VINYSWSRHEQLRRREATPGQPDHAVGANAGCECSPELVLYDPDHPNEAVDRFRVRLAELGIEPQDSAVLARGNQVRRRPFGGGGFVKPAAWRVADLRVERSGGAQEKGRLPSAESCARAAHLRLLRRSRNGHDRRQNGEAQATE
jgi:hypothetical protein